MTPELPIPIKGKLSGRLLMTCKEIIFFLYPDYNKQMGQVPGNSH